MKPNFNYVQPTEEQKERMQIFRDKFAALCTDIIDTVPNGRGRSVAFTKLEEASFWLNKAITLNDGILHSGVGVLPAAPSQSNNLQRGV